MTTSAASPLGEPAASARVDSTTPDSTRRLGFTRSRWAAIGAAVAVTVGAVGLGGLDSASAEKSSGDRPVFVPVNPCRLVDTRSGPDNVGPRSTPMGNDETATFQAHGENGKCTGASAIPNDALALSMNVTALKATGPTFLTFWGDGANPGTANLNPTSGQPPIPNAVTTPLSMTGSFNIYNERNNVDVVIDLNGYYVHHSHEEYAAVSHTHDEYAAKQTKISIGHTQFEEVLVTKPINTRLIGSGYATSSGIADQCMIAELPVVDGMTIDRVGVRGFGGPGAQVNVAVTRTRHAPGSSLSATDLQSILGTGSMTTAGAGTVAEGVATLTAPIVVDRATDGYYVTTCSASPYSITGAALEVSYK